MEPEEKAQRPRLRYRARPETFSFNSTEFSIREGKPVPLQVFPFSALTAILHDWLTARIEQSRTAKERLRRLLAGLHSNQDLPARLIEFLDSDPEFCGGNETYDSCLRNALRGGLTPDWIATIAQDALRARFQPPPRLPFYTFQEARAVGMALTTSPKSDDPGRSWLPSNSGDPALALELGDGMRVEYVPAPQAVSTSSATEEAKGHLGLNSGQSVLLFQMLLGIALSREGAHDVTLDGIVSAIWGDTLEAVERKEKRALAWRWVQNIQGFRVTGRRRGSYLRSSADKSISIAGPLLHITGQFYHLVSEDDLEGCSRNSDLPDVPDGFTLEPGEFLSEHRGNNQILPYIGDIDALLEIRGGSQRHREWALSIGLAIYQRARERVNRSSARPAKRSGSSASPAGTPILRMSREESLRLFPPSHKPELLLVDYRPGRVEDYWKRAIDLLERQQIVKSVRVQKHSAVGRKDARLRRKPGAPPGSQEPRHRIEQRGQGQAYLAEILEFELGAGLTDSLCQIGPRQTQR